MAITPAQYNLRPQRRADYPLLVQFKDSNKIPLDLTGFTVLAQVWDKKRTTKIGDFDVTLLDPAIGRVQLLLSHTLTEALPDESFYDVLVIDPSGLRQYYIEGVVRASEGLTTP